MQVKKLDFGIRGISFIKFELYRVYLTDYTLLMFEILSKYLDVVLKASIISGPVYHQKETS